MKPQNDSKPTSQNTIAPLVNEPEGEDDKPQFRKPEKGIGSRLTDEQYNQVCQDLIDGYSLTSVAQRNNIARASAQSIKEGIRDQIPDWKQRTSAKLSDLIAEMVDSLHQDLREGKLNPDRKSISIGILSDKKRDLDGEKTVIEHRRVDSEEDFRRRMDDYLASLPSAQTIDLADKPKNTSIIDVPAQDCTDSAQVDPD